MPFEDAIYHSALCYVRAGIPILPLDKDSKKLPSEGGINYLSATMKESTVRKWFGPEGKYRGMNLGIGCGMQGGVMALDIDAKPVSGTTGIKEIEKIVAKEGELPPGPRQRTPSGGFHYLYVWQDNAVSSSSKVANGIDTRGGTADRCTGHIVVYPSKVGGKGYEWEEGGDVPQMPEWLSVSLGQPWKEKPKEEKQKIEVPVHQINRMLTMIDPDALSYEDWVRVGMSLKATCGDDGLEIWDEWSRHGSRRKNGECTGRWKTFKEDGPIGFGTLLFMAKEAGWRPLPGDVAGSSMDAELEERVLEMNKHYALVRIGKNSIIATFSNNPNGDKIGFLAMQSFRDFAANQKVNIPTRNGFAERSMADIWMASEQRRQYYGAGIYPSGDAPTGILNMWGGWAVTPKEGDCSRYLSHLKDIICTGNEKIYNWIIDWMADAVQDARNVKGCCVVLRGVEGCGKGAWADTFGSLFGNHYTHIIDSERLTGRFNSMMSDSVIIYADEVLFPGDRKTANILKGLVSERRVVRESKGVDSVEVDNLARIVIASNEEWIIPAGPQSRRWLVLNVSPKVANNRPYFDALFGEMGSGGKAALLHLLLERKITSDLRYAPATKALLDQRMLSQRHDSLLHFIHEGTVKGFFDTNNFDAQVGDKVEWPRALGKFEFYSEYRNYCKDNRVSVYDTLSIQLFTKKLADYGFTDAGRTFSVMKIDDVKEVVSRFQGLDIDTEH
jgi:hypothetical protein